MHIHIVYNLKKLLIKHSLFNKKGKIRTIIRNKKNNDQNINFNIFIYLLRRKKYIY